MTESEFVFEGANLYRMDYVNGVKQGPLTHGDLEALGVKNVVPEQDSRLLMHKFVDEMKALLERFSWSATIPRHELLKVLRDSGVRL